MSVLPDFKWPYLRLEFEEGLHPETRKLGYALTQYSADNGIKRPVVTCIFRHSTDPLETSKNGWHPRRTAMDLRNIHYSTNELNLVKKWLQQYCNPKESWELITKDHGTAPHFHVAFRDYTWRK